MTKENDPHRLCTSCHGKTCSLDDGCEECHDLSDERCQHVGECMAKLLVQREKKHERMAKASSSSFSSFFFLKCLSPLCQLSSPSGSGIVTITPLLSVCVVTYLTSAPVISAAPFVAPLDVMSEEPTASSIVRYEERAKMLAAFEDI